MLQRDLLARVQRLTGSTIQSHQPVRGGYTPALRFQCRTAGSSFFVKAGATPLTSTFLRREIQMYQAIRGPFVPKVIAWEDHESTPILILEDLSASLWPPPWNDRLVDRVLAQIDTMHSTRVPLESFARVHGESSFGWSAVAEAPEPFLSLGLADRAWLEIALPVLLRAESQCSTEGPSLTHWDLRSDNMCIDDRRVLFVDWNHACLSNPRLDLGFWLPSLAYEGGPPPERILPDAPEVAAWVAGFFAARAGLPAIPDAPRVRLVQRQQLETALPWALRALELPPLNLPRGR